MSLEALRYIPPFVPVEEKRAIPLFHEEEDRGRSRILNPESRLTPWPMQRFIVDNAVDLSREIPTTPGIELWRSFRHMHHDEVNTPLAVHRSGNHVVAWMRVRGAETSISGETASYAFCAMRCSCCLPAVKSSAFDDVAPCEGMDAAIDQIAELWRGELSEDPVLKSLTDTAETADFLRLVLKNFSIDSNVFPPSTRSDRLSVRGVWMATGLPARKFRKAVEKLSRDDIVLLRDGAAGQELIPLAA